MQDFPRSLTSLPQPWAKGSLDLRMGSVNLLKGSIGLLGFPSQAASPCSG